jgi:hypothetical protein
VGDFFLRKEIKKRIFDPFLVHELQKKMLNGKGRMAAGKICCDLIQNLKKTYKAKSNHLVLPTIAPG